MVLLVRDARNIFDQAGLPQAVIDLCNGSIASDILTHREQLITMQTDLRMSVREEMQSNQSDEDRAVARACDYGARMQNFVPNVR